MTERQDIVHLLKILGNFSQSVKNLGKLNLWYPISTHIWLIHLLTQWKIPHHKDDRGRKELMSSKGHRSLGWVSC